MTVVTKFPQTVSGDYTDPDNVKADDEAYASVGFAANVTKTLLAYNFDFGIPSGSIINGVTVNCLEKGGVAGYMNGHLGTQKNQVGIGSNVDWGIMSNSYGDTLRTKTLNGEWTAEELNLNTLAGLAVAVSSDGWIMGGGGTHYIEYVSVSVDFTPPANSNKFIQMI